MSQPVAGNVRLAMTSRRRNSASTGVVGCRQSEEAGWSVTVRRDLLLRPDAPFAWVDGYHVDASHCGQTSCLQGGVIMPQGSERTAPRSKAYDDQATVDEGAEHREFCPFREINAKHCLSLRLLCGAGGVDKAAWQCVQSAGLAQSGHAPSRIGTFRSPIATDIDQAAWPATSARQRSEVGEPRSVAIRRNVQMAPLQHLREHEGLSV